MAIKSHGMSGTRLYTIWKNMKQRCYNPKRDFYYLYGAKGIKVWEEWHDFVPFMEWSMSNGYEEHLVIDRIDSDGDYTPDNCHWVTESYNSIKAVEKRIGTDVKGNVAVEYNGETKTLKEWAEEYSITYKVLYNRVRHGWEFSKALSKPIVTRNRRK
ncbi:HNH endonuclease [Bacillus phage Spock]|uniref:Uncharacterized protein n=2 Tax=Bequatrovirus spock TaxID=1918008 RepID=A0A1X9SGH5_9CAUD|nr:HNH endonuclease [Bacillus phage Spock]AGY48651.1 hypothetical protein Spock_251 [Bacillus phage Spock]ARQ95166.1 hypothetical protein FLAPJACK_255 [Bacillus phage Flapjack]